MFDKITKIVWKNKAIGESISYISLFAILASIGAGFLFSSPSFIGKLTGVSIGLIISCSISLISYYLHKTKFNLVNSKKLLNFTSKIEDSDIILEQQNTAEIEAKDFLALKQHIGILRKFILQQYISLHQEEQLDDVVNNTFLKEHAAKFVSLNATFPHAFKINVFDQIKSFSFFNYAILFKEQELLSLLLKLNYEIKEVDILSLKENIEDGKFKEEISNDVFNFLLEKQFYNSFDSELKKAIVSQLEENPAGREKLLAEYIRELANPENAKILENGEISVNLYKDIYKTLATNRTNFKGDVLKIIDEIEKKIRTIQSMQVESYSTKIELTALFDKDLPSLFASYQEIKVSPNAVQYEKTLIENLSIINEYLNDLINNKELDLSFNFKTQSNLVASKYKREDSDKLTMQSNG